MLVYQRVVTCLSGAIIISGPTSAKRREYNSGAVVTTTVSQHVHKKTMRFNFTCNATDRTEQVIDIPWFHISSQSSNNEKSKRTKQTWLSTTHLRINTSHDFGHGMVSQQDVAVKNPARAGLGTFLRFFSTAAATAQRCTHRHHWTGEPWTA